MQQCRDEAEMVAALRSLTEKICKRFERLETAAMTVTLKIKYLDFVQVTRSKTTSHYQRDVEQIYPIVDHLLHHPEGPTRPVRRLGVSLSNLAPEANGLRVPLPLPFNRPRPSGIDDILAGS
jgi:DNA polymerase-4